jgi:hypothetical protein
MPGLKPAFSKEASASAGIASGLHVAIAKEVLDSTTIAINGGQHLQ